MTWETDILDKLNGLSVTGIRAVDLATAVKGLVAMGTVKRVPRTLALAIKSRIFDAGTTDLEELTYLAKAWEYAHGINLLGNFYFAAGNRDLAGQIGYPAIADGSLLLPTGVLVLTANTTITRTMFPDWYTDDINVRLRVWGAGGGAASGGYNMTVLGSGAGGGGGYCEDIVRLADLLASPNAVIGAKGVGGAGQTTAATAGNDGTDGGTSSLCGRSATGGAKGLKAAVSNGGAGGVGSGGRVNATGGAGGPGHQSASNTARAGAGGSAAGPWGNGWAGGSGQGTTAATAPSGAGTGAIGSATNSPLQLGGASAAADSRWKSTETSNRVGGTPAAVSGTATSGPGCGGSPSNSAGGGNAGAFGGGAAAAGSNAGGNGGVGGGGGGTPNIASATGKGGDGGDGLILVEFFT